MMNRGIQFFHKQFLLTPNFRTVSKHQNKPLCKFVCIFDTHRQHQQVPWRSRNPIGPCKSLSALGTLTRGDRRVCNIHHELDDHSECVWVCLSHQVSCISDRPRGSHRAGLTRRPLRETTETHRLSLTHTHKHRVTELSWEVTSAPGRPGGPMISVPSPSSAGSPFWPFSGPRACEKTTDAWDTPAGDARTETDGWHTPDRWRTAPVSPPDDTRNPHTPDTQCTP